MEASQPPRPGSAGYEVGRFVVPNFRAFAIGAVGLAFASMASTQPSDAILLGCNALTDADKRLECMKAAMQMVKPQVAAWEGVSRAFVGMHGALESGISYRAYQSQLVDVAKELAIFKRGASPEAQPGIARLEQALDTYNDAARFWEAAISFYARRGNDLAYAGGLPMQIVGLDWMISKQQLPTRNADLFGFHRGVPTDLGRGYMWRKAKAEAEEGLALLAGPAKVSPSDMAAETAATAAAMSACREAFKQAKVAEDLHVPEVPRSGLGSASDALHFAWGGTSPALEVTVGGVARRHSGACLVAKSTGAVTYLEIDGFKIEVK